MLITLSNAGHVYWTKQHGAYITLITSWIVAVIITGLTILKLPAILFLLASVNVTELLIEKMKRKTPMQNYKLAWMNIYGLITIICGAILLIFSDSFRSLIIFLTVGSLVFLILARMKYQKSILSELFTFAFFVIASFAGSQIEKWSDLFIPVAVMILYFGSSVFTVKQRFERVNIFSVIIFTLASIILILWITRFSVFGITVSTLIAFKTSGCWAFPKKYSQLRIKHVGMLEGLFQLLLIAAFVLTY